MIAVRKEGREHLRILRKIAAGPETLLSECHTLPLLRELELEDLVFGIFPRVGANMREAIGQWAKNSVGDVMDMVMQALEVSGLLVGR